MTTYQGNLSHMIAVKIDNDLKAQLLKQAAAQQITLSAVARLAMKAGLATQQQPPQNEVHHA